MFVEIMPSGGRPILPGVNRAIFSVNVAFPLAPVNRAVYIKRTVYGDKAMRSQTPYQYARAELAAERFPNIVIVTVSGSSWLTDNDHTPLKSKTYKSRDAAERDRSAVLTRASKAHWS